jgi:hypothetical protein
MSAAALVCDRRRAAFWAALAIGLCTVMLGVVSPAKAVAPPRGEEPAPGEGPAGVVLTPDRTGTVTPAAPFTWDGAVATGLNTGFDPNAAGPCGKAAQNYCDITLVNVVPGDFYEVAGGGVEFSTTAGTTAAEDIDLYVYSSDAQGTVGQPVGASAGATADERVSVLNAAGYYLVVAVYYQVDNAGYSGRAEFFRRNRFPADIDDPRGFQDSLASNPRLGFRSHSEPHVSMSPNNHDVLVAGSKMYNRDPDSLAEYEFKIGSYVSFDRGRRWLDLGQINTCPQEQAPPSTWPLQNTCYPADDPSRAGTGPEDADDPRPDGDYGEEYLTSDVWTDFDDEGNAYAMVLDSPGFPSGNGWGMSFHRWESVSRRDVRQHRTWSNRIPINAYPAGDAQASTLDDKNTMAVNNAGPDRDGKTGIIVACWGQNYDLIASARQQEVCERSTDGGRSWPDDPQPISPAQDPILPFGPFVIGVHVIASNTDPNTFYAVWLDTLTGFLDGSGLSPFWFTKTTDGARTWEPARIITRIQQVPNVFPRQGFRNLSLPIMAASRHDDLYVTYADYNPAPDPSTDEDGMQADIKLLKSGDGGDTWAEPTKVNQDNTNADQFQPYVRVTERGQVNVSYFDRRLDRPEPPNHPGNYFIDTFLSRSNDEGSTFTDTRVSHDSWDPAINPPISPSGQFIGDYQGLVADDCSAIPFVNDTHLANDPSRDPDFDFGEPRSEFQQVFSYEVPNRPQFGGPGRHGHKRFHGSTRCRRHVHDSGEQDRGPVGDGDDVAAQPARVRLSRAARRAIARDPDVLTRSRVVTP